MKRAARRARVRVGTSGFVYDHWRRGIFYPPDLPAKDYLKFYGRRFDAVELNNTFYRLPRLSSVEDWSRAVSSRFVFAAKGSRFITHIKRLRDCRGP